MPQIGQQVALQKINEYINEVDKLLKTKYTEGQSRKESLNKKIRALIPNIFDHYEERLKEYDSDVNWFIAVAGQKETDEQKQEDYLNRLENMKQYLESYKEEIIMLSSENLELQTEGQSVSNKKIFIIHGHDTDALHELDNAIKELWTLETLVLKDRPGKGRTLIEKFEEEAKKASYAFAILTPDDIIKAANGEYLQARPNVIFELGWFYGKLGRNKVCILFKEGTSIHSDLAGISTIKYNNTINEKLLDIKKELKEASLI